ncbi:GIY-YIG nuclease family protein [Klebsiella pneumoniae]|nr:MULTISPECIES: GIY-YIG nuclease family protein [Klebsiella]HDH1369690.1 GIY-YIG nuclease family protein [Klebsiella quasipneumoniae subsp. similipneumoniae]EIW8646401.1 GIY-YIG nuclease family protein [Klebsiella pneumoniae]EKT9481584.1 GIY-YIG nuclease family protein [Klebsiella pneumoniae]EKV7988895.1 GIY-YIG nuclease family protein [Klebsiella pneumoniae]ELA0488414.1 GIY-YIG nuclease family protein [Klebsiella pneumoniae]
MEDWLNEILASDTQGLLKKKPKSSAQTADDHLIAKFKQINEFFDKHGREPQANRSNPIELMRSKSLESIRSNELHCRALEQYDIHGLLPRFEEPKLSSIEAILADDMLGILDLPDDSIFNLKHVKKTLGMPHHVAKRKKCANFDEYEPLFRQCHADLKTGEMEAVQFTGEQQIKKGMFFILHGVTCYVSDMEERQRKNGKINARLHLVFENGTESDMLLRSLATELYKDETGRRILAKSDKELDELLNITRDDKKSGYIYILKSLSNEPEISSVNNLYKIGYSTTPVMQRIANAEKEPTYLMASVQLVSEYECYNMRTHKFEGLLHTFFGHSCLDVQLTDHKGIIHTPREWFIAPLECIKQAIQMLITGDIVNYRYDAITQEIVERTTP